MRRREARIGGDRPVEGGQRCLVAAEAAQHDAEIVLGQGKIRTLPYRPPEEREGGAEITLEMLLLAQRVQQLGKLRELGQLAQEGGSRVCRTSHAALRCRGPRHCHQLRLATEADSRPP